MRRTEYQPDAADDDSQTIRAIVMALPLSAVPIGNRNLMKNTLGDVMAERFNVRKLLGGLFKTIPTCRSHSSALMPAHALRL